MSDAITYVDADGNLKQEIIRTWQGNAGQFMHIEDGYSIVALAEGRPIAVISAYTRPLLEPYTDLTEEFIDILEVDEAYRLQGIGRTLVERVSERAVEKGAYQVRAWSESGRHEVLMLWKKLGFALCVVKFERDGRKGHGFQVVKKL
jgi:GNAT superfamily N-acetyltransferase